MTGHIFERNRKKSFLDALGILGDLADKETNGNFYLYIVWPMIEWLSIYWQFWTILIDSNPTSKSTSKIQNDCKSDIRSHCDLVEFSYNGLSWLSKNAFDFFDQKLR